MSVRTEDTFGRFMYLFLYLSLASKLAIMEFTASLSEELRYKVMSHVLALLSTDWKDTAIASDERCTLQTIARGSIWD